MGSRGHVQKEEKRSFKCGMETNLVTDKKGPMEKGFLKTKIRVLSTSVCCVAVLYNDYDGRLYKTIWLFPWLYLSDLVLSESPMMDDLRVQLNPALTDLLLTEFRLYQMLILSPFVLFSFTSYIGYNRVPFITDEIFWSPEIR